MGGCCSVHELFVGSLGQREVTVTRSRSQSSALGTLGVGKGLKEEEKEKKTQEYLVWKKM